MRFPSTRKLMPHFVHCTSLYTLCSSYSYTHLYFPAPHSPHSKIETETWSLIGCEESANLGPPPVPRDSEWP